MYALTTRQRDILQILLTASKPVSSSELASLLNLTPRQVNYSIQGVRAWLNQRDQNLKSMPGTGFAIEVRSELAHKLSQEIRTHPSIQIILSVSQRRQLLALFLLTQDKPLKLDQLEQKMQVSRMTITKDLDEIERWLKNHEVILTRKPNFGVLTNGEEKNVQQALAEILWGETNFSGDPVVHVTHTDGLVFTLSGDARLLPLADYVQSLFGKFNLRRIISLVAKAEEQLGGRFTDDAVLYLSLTFAVMAIRISEGHHLPEDKRQIDWLKGLSVFPAADFIAQRLASDTSSIWRPGDIAGIAIHMLSAPRNEILAGEIEGYEDFTGLIDRLMEHISRSFDIDKLKHDRTLQNGLLIYLIPACYRERFAIWFPVSLAPSSLPEQDERELATANEILRQVYAHTGVSLPATEVDCLVVLLRAAIIRNRAYQFERIIVVCPSGMATAQLLTARLQARFPYLNNIEVTSLRDLTPSLVDSADLILTTVPFPRHFSSTKIIQIHPLLMPEDIEAITKFLS